MFAIHLTLQIQPSIPLLFSFNKKKKEEKKNLYASKHLYNIFVQYIYIYLYNNIKWTAALVK